MTTPITTSTTTLDISKASEYLAKISIKSIKDVRTLDIDLLIVLQNGDRIIISNGAVQALSAPETALQFAEGALPIGTLFQQIDQINLSPEANLTASSQEITRYNQNNAKVKEVKKPDEPDVRQPVAEPGEHAPAAEIAPAGVAGNSEAPNLSERRAQDSQHQMADVEINSDHDKSWSVVWPIATGALALLGLAGGGGGGGGAASAAASTGAGNAAGGVGAINTATALATTAVKEGIEAPNGILSGAAVLGPLNNAIAIAYDNAGHAISAAARVIDGHYQLTITDKAYRGLAVVVITDATPGLADNYIDEATMKMTDLGATVLRAVVTINGAVDQTVNVTALTELAALKAGIAAGITDLSTVTGVTADKVAQANKAIGQLFKVDAIAGDVVPTVAINAAGKAIDNPAFNNSASPVALGYGAALKVISNLTAIDSSTPTQQAVLAKLNANLEFADASGTSLRWATVNGKTTAAASALQGNLFAEPLLAIINDPGSTPAAVAAAQQKYDQLQKLPNNSTVSDFLTSNHVAIPKPTVYIKNAVVTDPDLWQLAPANTTLVLQQGVFFEQGLAVKAPPKATVSMTLHGKDVFGNDISVALSPALAGTDGMAVFSIPQRSADPNGLTTLSAQQVLEDSLLQFDPNLAVSAVVTVSDGNNSRTNAAEWTSNSDVRVDLSVPRDMTKFVGKLGLATDSVYQPADDPNVFPKSGGATDNVSNVADIKVLLTQVLKSGERLQFAVASALDADGNPIFGQWKEAATLAVGATDANGNVEYRAGGVVSANGSTWVMARVVLAGNQYAGGFGNSIKIGSPLQFSFDTVSPVGVRFQIADGKDDGIAAADGVTSQNNSRLSLTSSRESGAEIHFKLEPASGTTNGSLRIVGGDGKFTAVTPGNWYVLKSSDTLYLSGDTATGNGKVMLVTRQIDQAGNYSENRQTFVVDSTGIIEQTVAVANSHKAVNDAQTAVGVAQADFDAAGSATKAAKQFALVTAKNKLAAAQAAEATAIATARAALVNPDGSTKLDGLLGSITDKAYVSAIANRIAASGDPEAVNSALGLKAVVDAAIKAADTALGKAAQFGDSPDAAAPTLADFKDMGIDGVTNAAQLAVVNEALRSLPADASNSIPKVQAAATAYNKLLALADGKAGNAAAASLPGAQDFAAIGVTPPLSDGAVKMLAGVIDALKTSDIDTIAKIDVMAAAAQRLAQQAQLPPGGVINPPLTPADFAALGIAGVTVDNVADVAAELSQVPQRLRDSGAVSGVVDTLAELKAVVAANIGTLQTIINYAQGVAPIDPERPQLLAPALSDYARASAGGAPLVDAGNLAAVNSAVRSLAGAEVDSWNKISAIAQSFNTILAAANGTAGDALVAPTYDDLLRVGVKSLKNAFSDPASIPLANAMALLDQVIDASQRTQVDSQAKLDALAGIVARVVQTAAGAAIATPLTADELNQLHFSPVIANANQLAIVLSAIAGTAPDGSDITSLSALGAVANNAFAAARKIADYAHDATTDAPTMADYHALGIKAVNDASMSASVNSVLALPAIDNGAVDTPAKIQAIVDAYNKVLARTGDAAGVHQDPAAADYTTLGVSAPLNNAAGKLAGSVLVGKSDTDVASVDKLKALMDDINAIERVAAADRSALAGDTVENQQADLKLKLAALGIAGLDDRSMAAVMSALQASPDDGSGIDSLGKLQALADQARLAQFKLMAYADDALAASPDVADYAALGVEHVDSGNLAAINAALASAPVTSREAATPALLQQIVDAYDRILAAANGVAGDAPDTPSAGDYAKVGLSAALVAKLSDAAGRATPVLGMLGTLVDKAARDGVDTPAKLDTLADIADRIMQQAQGAVPAPALTIAELRQVGITGLDDHTFASVLSAIAAGPADGSNVIGLNAIGALKLQTLATQANAAQLRIEAYADGKGALVPTVADYAAVGVKTAHVDALNSALSSTAIGASEVNPPAKIAAIVAAYDKVLAAADGVAPADGSLSAQAQLLSAQVLGAIGVSGLKAGDDSVNKALAAVIDAMTPDIAGDVRNLQAAADAYGKISRLANGIAGDAAAADMLTNPIADLHAVGVNVSDPVLAGAVVSAVDAVKFSAIDTPSKLSALVDSYARILAEANEAEPLAGASYGNQDLTPDATPGSDPGVNDLKAIGAVLPGLTAGDLGTAAQQASHLALLDDVLKRKARSQVDNVSEINALGEAVHAMLMQAGNPVPAVLDDAARQQWERQFQILGVSGVDISADGNLTQVLQKFTTVGMDKTDTVAEIQTLVDEVNAALLVITNYAKDSVANAAPSVQNYIDAGITIGAGGAIVNADNVASINAALTRLSPRDVDTRSKVKALVNAYNDILTAADGTAGDASGAALTAQHYVRIGVPVAGAAIGLATVTVDPATNVKTISAVDADKLLLLNSAIGAQPRSGVATPDKITALAATASDLIRLGKESGSDPVSLNALTTTLSVDSLKQFGLTDISTATVAAVLNAVKFKGNPVDALTNQPLSTASAAATHDVSGIDTVEQLRAIVTSYNKVQGYINNGAGAMPGGMDYTNLGVTLPDSSANALALLSSALHLQTDFAAVDTVGELNALALTAAKLMQVAAVKPLLDVYPVQYPAVSVTFSSAELTRLGLTGIDANNLPALLNKLQTTADDGAAAVSVSGLQSLLDAAALAQKKIYQYAQNKSGDLGDHLGVPAEADFQALGLALPSVAGGDSGAYLDVINDALRSASMTGDKARTPTQLQGLVTAAQHVLDAADGTVGNALVKPGYADFAALGLSTVKLDNAGANGVAMLADAVDASTIAALTHDDTGKKQALPDKLAELLNMIQSVMVTAAGGVSTPAVDQQLLQKLGVSFDGMSTTAAGLTNWPAMYAAIVGSKDDGSEVNSLAKLQALVQRAETSQNKIRDFAEGVGTVADPATVPVLQDYRNVGLVDTGKSADGSQTPLVTSSNLDAVNAALRTVAINGAKADTPARLKVVVDAYNAILRSANGSGAAADPAVTADQYSAIGVVVDQVTTNTGKATAAAALSLLDTVINGKNAVDVNTPAKIEQLGSLVNKVLAQATATDDTAQVSTADLTTLGILAADGSTLAAQRPAAVAAALYAIRVSPDDGSAVATLGKLQATVARAITAYNKIQAYADLGSTPADFPADANRPTADDLAALGLQVPANVRADQAVAVAASLLTSAINASQVDTPAKIQQIINDWDQIFSMADGSANALVLTDATRPSFQALLTRVGVDLGSAPNAPAVDLLYAALDVQPASHGTVNGPAKIAGLFRTANAVMDLAGAPSYVAAAALPISKDQLTALGIVLDAAVTNEGIAAILSAIAAKKVDTDVDSLGEIQTIANAALLAQQHIAAYAKDASQPTPALADYTAIGLLAADGAPLVGVADLGAVNSALVAVAKLPGKANDPAGVKNIVDAYHQIIAASAPGGAVPALESYASIGITGATAATKPLLDSVLPTLSADRLNNVAQLQKSADAAALVTRLADGASNTDPASLPQAADFVALGVNLVATDSAKGAAGISLLGSVIDQLPAASVGTRAQIQAYADIVNKLTDAVGKADGTVTVADLSHLGITVPASVAEQGAILAAIGTSKADGTEIKSLADLRLLAQRASDALAKISQFADDNTGAALGVPDAEDYRHMGVAGVNASNVGAMNAALATMAVGRDQADTQAEVKQIADTYNKILALADGIRTTPDPAGGPLMPTAADLVRLGVNIAPGIDAHQLNLLTTAIDAVSSDLVDAPAKIDALSQAAARFVAASGNSDAAGLLTVDDFLHMGVSGLDDAHLAGARALVASTAVADLDSSAKLQRLVDGLLRDLKVIRNYADGIVNTDPLLGDTGKVLTPTVDNYGNVGVTGVAADNLASINAAVNALGNGNKVDSKTKLQTMVDAYRLVLAAADGVAGNTAAPVTRAALLAIGVDAGRIADPDASGLSVADAAKARAVLGILSTAIDAQPADKSTVATPAKLNELADLAAKVVTYAAAPATAVAPTSADLAALGVRNIVAATSGSTPSTMTLINAAIGTDTVDGIGTLAQLQTIATAAYKVRNMATTAGVVAAADRVAADAVAASGEPLPGAPLTLAEIKALGVTALSDNASAIRLFNDAVDAQADFASVASPSALAGLADIVGRVMTQADAIAHPPATPVSISVADWRQLGLDVTGTPPNVNADSLSAFMAVIRQQGLTGVDTIAELKALGTAAYLAQAKIKAYAQAQTSGVVTDTTADAAQPIAKDFADMGVTGLSLFNTPVPGRLDGKTEGLFAVLSSLATLDVSGAQVTSAASVQAIVDSYNKILGLADGVANMAAGNAPTLSDFVTIGANIGTAATQADYLRLLNSTLDQLSIVKVDTPAEIGALAGLVGRVLDYARRVSGAAAPARADLEALGLSGLDDADMPAVQRALFLVSADNIASINTLPGLQNLVDKAIAAQKKVRDYANGGIDAPTAGNYAEMGVILPTSPSSVAGTILGAVNAALASAPVSGAQVDTPVLVQGIVDSYAKILPLADGLVDTPAASLPDISDFTRVGMSPTVIATLQGVAGAPVLSLFNDLLDSADSAAKLATPARLDDLARAAGKVLALAAQDAGASPLAADLTDADFAALGLTGLSAAEKAAVIGAIQIKSAADVDTLAEVTALAQAARNAINKIVAYAQTNTGAAPEVADFDSVGVTGVRESASGVLPGNKNAIDAALASALVTGDSASTPAKLQAIVNSYGKLLAQADGTYGNTADAALADATDLGNIGIDLGLLNTLGNAAAANAAHLLSSTVDAKSVADVDTPQKIQNLADTVAKVALVVHGDASSHPLAVADFTTLGIAGVTDTNLADVVRYLGTQVQDGSATNTLGKLADVVFAIANAPLMDTVAGDDVVNLAERSAGIKLTGTAGRDSIVKIVFPDGSSREVSTVDTGKGGPVWSWSLDLGSADLTTLLGADGKAKTLSIQARNTLTGQLTVTTQHKVDVDTVAPSVTGVTDNIVADVTNGPIEFTVTFSEALNVAPTAGHFSAANGSVTNVTSLGGNAYKVSVTPAAGIGDGVVALTLLGTDGMTALRDAAGNPVADSTSLASLGGQRIDTLAPTVASVADNVSADVTNGAIQFTVTLSEALAQAPTTSHFSATHGTVTGVTAVDAKTFKVDVTPDAGVTGGAVALTLKGSAGGIVLRDALGNAMAATTDLAGLDSQNVDTVAPTITGFNPADGSTVDLSPALAFTFSLSETVSAVAGKSFRILKVADDSLVDTLDAAGSQVTISGTGAATTVALTSSKLASLTHYYITMDAGALKDLAGNSIAGMTATGAAGYDFTTAEKVLVQIAGYGGEDGRASSTAIDGISSSGQLNVSYLRTDSDWQYSLDNGATWNTVSKAAGTYSMGAGVTVVSKGDGTAAISLPEGVYEVLVHNGTGASSTAAGLNSLVQGLPASSLTVDWFTKAIDQTTIMINGVRSIDAGSKTGVDGNNSASARAADTVSDNYLVNGASGAGKGELLTLAQLGLTQGLQAGKNDPASVTIAFSNFTAAKGGNLTIYLDGTALAEGGTVSMADVIAGKVRLEYAQSDASILSGGAFARADYTISEAGWNSTAGYTRSLDFAFTANKSVIYGDASGNGGQAPGTTDISVMGYSTIAAQAGKGGVDALLGGTLNDVIFGDGSGGGGSLGSTDGSSTPASSTSGAAGGGGNDVIFGGAGNDIIFGDGYGGSDAARYLYSTTYTGGIGGIGGGGGGGASQTIPSNARLSGGTGGDGAGSGGGSRGIPLVGGSNGAFDGGASTLGTPHAGGTHYADTGGFGAGVVGADVGGDKGYNTNAIVIEDAPTASMDSWSQAQTATQNTSAQITNASQFLMSLIKANLNITSQTPGSGNDILRGGAGNDFIAGGNGDDLIYGGSGNDIMWGVGGTASGSNNDVFVWTRGDAGLAGASDEIRDWNAWSNASKTGMKLDISDLLENHAKGSTTNLAQWITSISNVSAATIDIAMNVSGLDAAGKLGGTKIVIDVDGAGAGTVQQTIYLRNTTSTIFDPQQWVSNGWIVV